MTRKTPRSATLDDLLAATEGVWHEAPHGFDLAVVHEGADGDRARVVIPLKPAVARSLKPRAGEVLEATVRGRNLELVRRRRKPSARG